MSVKKMLHGIDVVELSDFKRLIEPPLDSQLRRLFSDRELQTAGTSELRLERLAARFAVKEAVLKALRVGFGDGVAFTDVETINDEMGAPDILLHGRVAEAAANLGIGDWLVSTSHAGDLAIASVIGQPRG